jgi:ketosteroid isomerase-like protein
MILTILGMLAASHAVDVAAIKALRARSNAAIAAHDVSRLKPLQTADYTILPGSLGKPLAWPELETRLSQTFKDATFVTYLRTPRRIVIGSSRKRAAETGTWLGTWRKKDGEMRLSGVYQAVWVPRPEGWRLQNESFVTLRCTGSRSCADVD